MISSQSLKNTLSKHIYKMITKNELIHNYFSYKIRVKGESLTGVATLTHVIEAGQEILENGFNLTTLIIGLDNFKQFNDTYGYLTANNVLLKFGQRLLFKTANLNCVVGRLGGDEFVVLIKDYPHIQGDSLSVVLYNLLKDELYQIEPNIEPLKVAFSIGEAVNLSISPSNIQKLIQKAEANMEYNKYKNRKAITDIEQNIDIFHKEANQLLKVLSEKDMYTYVHSQYTAKYAVALAESLGLSDGVIENICIAGWLHDIGKIVITSDILRKPTKLEQDEYSIIQQHVMNGLNIIRTFNFPETVKNAIQYHHERWDGKGYPYGISGEDTPIEGRILQITDAFSAMTIKRIYRDQLTVEGAIEEIIHYSGSQFDPQLSSIFIDMLKNKRNLSIKTPSPI